MKKDKKSMSEEDLNDNISKEEIDKLFEQEQADEVEESQENQEDDVDEDREGLVEETQEEDDVDELEELRGKYLRLVAEFDNHRKRTAKERVELIQTAEKKVIQSLLDVLDDADRAEVEMNKTDDADSIRGGATLIFDKLRKVLKKVGLQEMDSLHKEYDAELQEAVAEIPAPSEEMKGKVIDNVQKGYYLNDKIIRHAKVVVGK